MTLAGIEPATVALQARRSNHRANQPLVSSHLNEFIKLTSHANERGIKKVINERAEFKKNSHKIPNLTLLSFQIMCKYRINF